MRFRYEKSLSIMVVFGFLMSSSAAHANNIYFSEDGLINLENSSLHADDGSLKSIICDTILLLEIDERLVGYCLR